ncbi:MAG TPA: histidine--tRNA ligase [Cyclobacteriaceae bacterium]|nr:histidine--tRNA ligase [Cyclobacteriaceae bacterium]
MDKPTLPKGTRDFGPAQMARRQFIFNTIRKVFEKYGFQPLETPAMENLSTLTGKYGEEGDQLLFKILNSGDFLKEADIKALESRNSKLAVADLAEKGLKYDLTVPFARFVVMNRHELPFPFKRYQIQPVWRADRPQKGRYREFYQCDADVIGTDSLVCEAEIILMIKEVFSGLQIKDYTIKLNHRGILSALAQLIGAKENESALFVAMDKLDKIGEAKVREELQQKNFENKKIDVLFEILNFKGTTAQKIDFLNTKLSSSELGKKSLDQLKSVLSLLDGYGAGKEQVEFDVALARGLSYYTGCIFEVKIGGVAVGSVSGGGRYDNLTGVFGMPGVSGVGISFGVDRLYDAMEELTLFNEETQRASQVLVCHLDEACFHYALKTVHNIREKGFAAEVYPDISKLKKQLEYADRKKIPFTIVIGSDEMKSGKLAFKNMKTGEQHMLSVEEILSKLQPNA